MTTTRNQLLKNIKRDVDAYEDGCSAKSLVESIAKYEGDKKKMFIRWFIFTNDCGRGSFTFKGKFVKTVDDLVDLIIKDEV